MLIASLAPHQHRCLLSADPVHNPRDSSTGFSETPNPMDSPTTTGLLSRRCPQRCQQLHPQMSGPPNSSFLLERRRKLLYLVVDLALLPHEFPDLVESVHDRCVIAATELFTDLWER
jgi:hypothetical protein